MKIDNREIADKNELLVLTAINRCAYLRAKEAASLIWPDGSADSGQRMAQRTLKRLYEKREVLRTSGPGGAILYALAEKGASRLVAECNIDAKSGKDAIRSIGNFYHRCMCTAAFILCELAQKLQNWTEHELLSEKGLIFQWHSKKPDLMVFSKTKSEKGWWWVECEHSIRNTKEMQRLSIWLQSAIYAPIARECAIEIGTNGDIPLMGVVLLFETESALLKLKERTKSAIETWIDPASSVDGIPSVGAGNKASLFISNYVHFVLLSEFQSWLEMDEPWLYSPGPAPIEERVGTDA